MIVVDLRPGKFSVKVGDDTPKDVKVSPSMKVRHAQCGKTFPMRALEARFEAILKSGKIFAWEVDGADLVCPRCREHIYPTTWLGYVEDEVSGDHITHGDIVGSTGVAIGSNIKINITR